MTCAGSKIQYRAPVGVSARQILMRTASEHKLSVDIIISRRRKADIVEARTAAIAAMKAAGIPISIMARVCNRERTTILYFANPKIRERKKLRNQRLRDQVRASA